LANAVFAGPNPQFKPPQRIIAQAFGRHYNSHRPFDTVVPLAKMLDLPIDDKCDGDKFHCIHRKLKRSVEDPILVSWAHTRLPNLIGEFGISHSHPYPEHRFDLVWVLDTVAKTCTEIYQNCDSFGLYANGRHGLSNEKLLEMKNGTNLHVNDEGGLYHIFQSNPVYNATHSKSSYISYLSTKSNIICGIIITLSLLIVLLSYIYGDEIINRVELKTNRKNHFQDPEINNDAANELLFENPSGKQQNDSTFISLNSLEAETENLYNQ
jgi:hypothetical protein